MSHLKVELQSLKRSSLPHGYAFDLTRYCAGCWAKLGRVINRGRKCRGCKKRTCRECRIFVDSAKWICITCYTIRSSRQDNRGRAVHEILNVGFQKTATYLPLKTSFGVNEVEFLVPSFAPFGGSHAYLDTNRQATPLHCLPPPGGNGTSKNIITEEVVSPITNSPGDDQSDGFGKLTPKTGSMSMDFAQRSPPTNHSLENGAVNLSKNLCHGSPPRMDSATSPFSSANFQCFPTSTLRQKEFCSFESPKLLSDPSSCMFRLKEANENGILTKTEGSNNSSFSVPRRTLAGQKDDSSLVFMRNDPYSRFSVRDDRCNVRPGTRCFPPVCPRRHFQDGLKSVPSKSISLPEKISDSVFDLDALHCDFVECRVKKLEEDLAAGMGNGCAQYDDIDLNSLYALDLEWRVPDREGYKLVYLSSSAASEDSNMDSSDTENSLHLDTCVAGQTYKNDFVDAFPDSVEWDFAISEFEGICCSSDDESDINYPELGTNYGACTNECEDVHDTPHSTHDTSGVVPLENDVSNYSDVITIPTTVCTYTRSSDLHRNDVYVKLGCLLSNFTASLRSIKDHLIFDADQNEMCCVSGTKRRKPCYRNRPPRHLQCYGKDTYVTPTLEVIDAKFPMSNFFCLDYSSVVPNTDSCAIISVHKFPKFQSEIVSYPVSSTAQANDNVLLESIPPNNLIACTSMDLRQEKCFATEGNTVFREKFANDCPEVWQQVEHEGSELQNEPRPTRNYYHSLCAWYTPAGIMQYSADVSGVSRHDCLAFEECSLKSEILKSREGSFFPEITNDFHQNYVALQRLKGGKLFMQYEQYSSLSKILIDNLFMITFSTEKQGVLIDFADHPFSLLDIMEEMGGLVSRNGLPTSYRYLAGKDRVLKRIHCCGTTRTAAKQRLCNYAIVHQSCMSSLERDVANTMSDGHRVPKSIDQQLLHPKNSALIEMARLHTVFAKSYLSDILAFDFHNEAKIDINFIMIVPPEIPVLKYTGNKDLNKKYVAAFQTEAWATDFSATTIGEISEGGIARKNSDNVSKLFCISWSSPLILNLTSGNCCLVMFQEKRSNEENFRFTNVTVNNSERKMSFLPESQISSHVKSRAKSENLMDDIKLESHSEALLLGDASDFPFHKETHLVIIGNILSRENTSEGSSNGSSIAMSKCGENSDTILLRRENLPDVVGLSTGALNLPPETEVIDTYAASVTSKTGCTAFAKSRSRASLRETVLLPLDLYVPAVQRSVKHERQQCSQHRGFSIASVCDGVVKARETSGSRPDISDPRYNLSRAQDYNETVLTAILSNNGNQCCFANVDLTLTACVKPSTFPAPVIPGTEGFHFDACAKNMSLANGISQNTRGSKIAELKKFFDSAAQNYETSVGGKGGKIRDVGVNKRCGLPEHTMEPVANPFDGDLAHLTTRASSKCDAEFSNNYSRVENDNLTFSESCDENVVASETSFRNGSNNVDGHCVDRSSEVALWNGIDVESKGDCLWDLRHQSSGNNNVCAEVVPKISSQVVSTFELSNLIATSRAEISRKEESIVLSEKSNLESYFANAFEDKPQHKFSPSHTYCSSLQTDENIAGFHDGQSSEDFNFLELEKAVGDCVQDERTTYASDMDEMYFDDLDEATLSDTSSEEEMRCRPSPPHVIPQPYALHTIIEESCEESERDSQSATPTNQGPASKLEKYFSWEIINNTRNSEKRDRRDDDDDESTIYSDSLSEASGSLNGDNDIEPSPLSSSRLEKYFTSGLVGGDVTYQYPDDAEFLDDTSVSDFDEETYCHKISRSALLNSLNKGPKLSSSAIEPCLELGESLTSAIITPGPEAAANTEEQQQVITNHISSSGFEAIENSVFVEYGAKSCSESSLGKGDNVSVTSSNSELPGVQISGNFGSNVEIKPVATEEADDDPVKPDITTSLCEETNCEAICDSDSHNGSPSSKNVIETDLAFEVTKKVFSDDEDKMNYISAWQLLETEIQQLMKNVSTTSQIDNNSNSSNSSIFGSSHSDYGSDTVESGECLTTDEDDNCADPKCKKDASHSVSSGVKVNRTPVGLHGESAEIWKKILQSFNGGKLLHYLNLPTNASNPDTYVREYVVSLVKSLTNGQKLPTHLECEDADSQQAVLNLLENAKMVHNEEMYLKHENVEGHLTNALDTAAVDEGISVDSTENIFSDCENSFTPLASVHEERTVIEEGTQDVVDLTSNDVLSCSQRVSELSPVCGTGMLSDSSVGHDLNETDSRDKDLSLKSSLEDSSSQFSVYVDIEIREDDAVVIERQQSRAKSKELDRQQRSSLHFWASDDATPEENDVSPSEEVSPDVGSPLLKSRSELCLPKDTDVSESPDTDVREALAECLKSSRRDTGYFSFKSSDNCVLHSTEPEIEVLDFNPATTQEFGDSHPSSRCSSIRSNLSVNSLSQSVSNISQGLNSELKFSTLQPKPRLSKVSMNPQHPVQESRNFTSYFSPATVFKKLKTTKNHGSPSSEISYPSKYLKKYGRSSSFDSDNMSGATSMPHLNSAKQGDSHSMNGVIIDCDRESSLALDDEVDGKHSYFNSNHSILSLGARSDSTASVYSAAGGRYYGTVSVSGDVLFGLNYNQKSQTMEVFVKQCRNLTAVDAKKNRSDPYVKVYLLPDKTKGGKRKTKTKKNTLNPVFNELLRFPVLKHELESRTLWLSVWNSDLFGRNDFLGEVMLGLGYRLLDSPTLRWYPLQERAESLTSPLSYKGELFLALRYVPRDLSLESRFRPAPVISLKGALHVLVKEARNISASKNGGTVDTFCKSYLLPDKSKGSKQKTPVVKKSSHPKWYYTMVYEDLTIDELKERSLELTLWDHDKITSNEFIGGVRLNIGTSLYHGVPVEWMDASRNEVSLWQAMLEQPNMWIDGSLPLRPTMQSLRS